MRALVTIAFVTVFALTSGCGGGGGGGGFLPDDSEPLNPLAITTTDLPEVGELPYAAVLEGSGGMGGYSWSLPDDGGLPFTMDEDGILRLEAAAPRGTYGITVSLQDEEGTIVEQSYTISVSVAPLVIVTASLNNAVLDESYSALLEAEGGVQPYAWRLLEDGGTGLELSSSGVLSGALTRAGTYGLTFLATDAAGSEDISSLLLTVVDETAPLSINFPTLPDASVGERYAAALSASGGTGDYDWSLVDAGGSGLNLSDEGVLRGTLRDEGLFGITVRVSDGENSALASTVLSAISDAEPLAITTTALPGGTVDRPFAAVLRASGGTGDYSWSLVDAGGSGLELSSSGVLSGVPAEPGTFGVAFRVNDGDDSVASAATVSVSGGTTIDPLSIQTQSIPSAEEGESYAVILSAAGGVAPYEWTLLDGDGTGLVLSASGALQGTAPTPGSYVLSIEVMDANETTTRSNLILNVSAGEPDGPDEPVIEPVQLVTEELPDAVVGRFYSTILSATGGSGRYSWTLVDADGAENLELDAVTGILSWPGDDNVFVRQYIITIQVQDTADASRADIGSVILNSTLP